MKIQLPKDVQKILAVLEHKGYEAYVVGGCVRDSILNKIPNDWDICTNCSPEKMLAVFSMFKVIPTGLKHGTVTVVVNNVHYEVTTYRIDGDYLDGRHPEKVLFTNELREDLRRRDFTINAMAYNHKVGFVDYYGGIEDMARKRIRSVGNPLERFREDYLRMLRAIRFSAQLEYDLDIQTQEAIKGLSGNIVCISAERIREELNKILMVNTPSIGLKLLEDTGLLKYILPELDLCVGFQQHNPHHTQDVFYHILDVVDQTEKDLILRLSALFHDIGKPETFRLDEEGIGHFYRHSIKGAELTAQIMKRLRYDKKSIEQVVILVKEHMSSYDAATEKAIKRLINRVGMPNIHRLFDLQIADKKAMAGKYDLSSILEARSQVEKILNEKEPLSIADLKISGQDLIHLGIPQGKTIGILLNELMEIILEKPELNTRDTLLEIAAKYIEGSKNE